MPDPLCARARVRARADRPLMETAGVQDRRLGPAGYEHLVFGHQAPGSAETGPATSSASLPGVPAPRRQPGRPGAALAVAVSARRLPLCWASLAPSSQASLTGPPHGRCQSPRRIKYPQPGYIAPSARSTTRCVHVRLFQVASRASGVDSTSPADGRLTKLRPPQRLQGKARRGRRRTDNVKCIPARTALRCAMEERAVSALSSWKSSTWQ